MSGENKQVSLTSKITDVCTYFQPLVGALLIKVFDMMPNVVPYSEHENLMSKDTQPVAMFSSILILNLIGSCNDDYRPIKNGVLYLLITEFAKNDKRSMVIRFLLGAGTEWASRKASDYLLSMKVKSINPMADPGDSNDEPKEIRNFICSNAVC